MGVAAAIAGAAVIGGVATISSGNKAASAQRDASATAASASERATEAQVAEAQRQYDTTRADYAPYRAVGYGAVGKLAGMYGVTPTNADGTPVAGATTTAGTGYANDGGFTASPGYKFQLDQGIQAAERSAAARGSFNSGGTTKAIARYATGLASSEYDTYANRLAALAGVGQTATAGTAAAGQAASGTIAGAYGQNGVNQANAAIAAGNATASSYANTGAAINNGAQNLASAYLYSGRGGAGLPANSYGIVGSGNTY